ncbi:amidohydrolase [Shimia sp. R9_1]|uniref:amidohydrolase n=1 Tax=Shimia sp. R9_1 TaxID=2821111 RepID=UPI001ADD54C9|nr:amidohydrolase [Shimia sp. R9_1]MBO9407820.1 amidohydrolase [Shimia sp. R9_1]
MRHLFLPVAGAIALSCSALFTGPAHAQDIADTIYSGGTILTMDDSAPRAEALATKNGRILAVGTLADLLAHQGESTRTYDLDGRTMLPGFVDSHGHVVMGGLQALSANLLAPPDGDVTDIASLQEALRAWMADNQDAIAASNLIVGFGYDQSQLAEQRHPTKEDLDAVSTDVPIILVHQSGHFGAVNTAALFANDITKRTPVPPGGIIRYGADGEPDGVLEENAFFMVLGQMLGGIGDEGFKAFARAGAKLWASFGYTTAQEGRATPQVAAIAREVAAEGGMDVDVVVYPDVLVDRDFILANQSATYDNGVRIGGAKLTIDGSPQGFTALRDRPYFDPVGNYPPGYAGYASATPEQVQDAINWAFGNDIQILTHANGEGASDMLIAAIDAAEETHGRADRRPVLIHGQFLRPDQVAALDRLDVFPSLFPMHTFYWGDWHRDRTVGPINADNISPTGWVRERGMMFGTHHDAPVAFPDSMRVLSATVTRRTRSGDILGPHQRVDVMTALKAMTLWPAYQHFEEAEKGSLEVGKIADFVILSDDPTAVDPEALDTLKVVATIKDGSEIYRAKDGPQKTFLVPPVGHHVLDVAHAAARKN